MNKKYTKRALFGSVIALVLCCAMLVGTTFAWFTDTASSAGNKIEAGTLKVDLEVLNKETGKWESVANMTDPIFDYDNWEPGYTEVKLLQVVNEGSLALKWKAKLVANVQLSSLANVIDVYVNDGAKTYPADRAEFEASYTRVGTLAEFVNTIEDTTTGNIPAGEGNRETLGIAFKMQESAGNIYQGMDLGGAFDITIVATQDTVEEDSFDNQYDADAEFPVADVITATDLLNGESSIIAADSNVTIDLSDAENAEYSTTEGAAFMQNNGGSVVVNGANTNVTAGSAANYGAIAHGGETVYNDFVLNSNGGGIGATSAAKVVYNSGSVYVDSASTSGRYIFYAEGAGTEITINGGDFSWDKADNQKRAYIYAGAGTTVYVNGGTFGPASTRSGYTAGILGEGTIVIKGGTFGFDPSAWVADGYQAVKSGTTWTVSAK